MVGVYKFIYLIKATYYSPKKKKYYHYCYRNVYGGRVSTPEVDVFPRIKVLCQVFLFALFYPKTTSSVQKNIVHTTKLIISSGLLK